MTRARKRVWVEVLAVVVMVVLGGVLSYSFLPYLTTPNQRVVPPPLAMGTAQTVLTLFIVATAVGAPVTAGIVLVLVAQFVSRRVPASSSTAPEIPPAQSRPRNIDQPRAMSPREALIWKLAATGLLLLVAAGAMALFVAVFMQLYPG